MTDIFNSSNSSIVGPLVSWILNERNIYEVRGKRLTRRKKENSSLEITTKYENKCKINKRSTKG